MSVPWREITERGVVESADRKPFCDVKTGHLGGPPEEVTFEQRPKGGSDVGL